ncbi:hypothetical protein E1286_44665 [Nonomuraea terrae]|uniref:Peptidase M48 domain-containing protein n=1 Tax=Nonomuraea terrae TaxID=2530383 RepID=A0A4V2YHM4_9ACTN|nr:hypothetical protein [Nonomuraea terrae]TDD31617.1 hypothetical protein E1286_44665 [Nonomuraea terrae]
MKRLSALLLASVVHLLTLAFAVLGASAILREPGSFVSWVIGAPLLAIGWALRPRLGRLPADAEVLDRSAAPELYGAAARVADRVGVPPPGKVAVRDLATETRYERVGLARTPVLVVGLPLWLALPPTLRAALLATAYARRPTGGERLVGEALNTLESWRDALLDSAAPLKVRQEAQTAITASSLGVAHQPGTAYEVAGFIGRLFGRVLGGPVLLMQYALTRLAGADEGRTEARRRAPALRAVAEAELARLEQLAAGGGYLAPMQAAALRGESVTSIRQGALARFRLTADGVLTAPPGSELIGAGESELIDQELRAHYSRAIRGFGLIS